MVGVRLCCCKKTLWKVDPSDGSIVWKRDRRANSVKLKTRTDAGTTYNYECGNSGSRGEVSKWNDSGDNLWNFNKSATQGLDVEYSAGDGVVWASINDGGTWTLYRINDSTGAEISSSSITAASLSRLYDAPSSNMNHFNGGVTNQYDSSFSVAASFDHNGFTPARGLVPIARDAATNGFMAGKNTSPNQQLHQLNTDLSSAASTSSFWVGGNDRAASSTKYVGRDGSVIRQVTISGLTTDWTTTIDLGLYIHDASNNVYTSGSSANVKRFNASTGFGDWVNSDFSTISPFQVEIDATYFYICGQFTDPDVWHVAAFGITDGTLAWKTNLGTLTHARDMKLAGDGYLYLCGDRG